MPLRDKLSPQSKERIDYLKRLSQDRELRAKEILMAGNPQILSEEEFLVPSSNGKDQYRVIHVNYHRSQTGGMFMTRT